MTSTLRETVEHRFEASVRVPERFFAVHEERIADACRAMAARFHRGGRLLVFGEGAEASDAQHVAVEFVHPVIVGKRALPAIALPNDHASLTGVARAARAEGGGAAQALATTLEVLGRPVDIAMGISRDTGEGAVRHALARAAELGMLTVAVCGASGVAAAADGDAAAGPHRPVTADSHRTPARSDRTIAADFEFMVDSNDPLVVQETQETLYHVLWELVHVFFDHGLGAGDPDALH